uniref:Uncharacterized protein n=1 Tax=Panagrolaimus sp. JU765 TaxID=591449 RepID=A0AC34QYB3_9BILA
MAEEVAEKIPNPDDSGLLHDRDIQQAIEDADRAKQREEEIKNKSRWRRIKETMVEWGILSSCHGVPHMAQAHSLLAVIVWIIILGTCSVIFLYLFADTLKQYLAFEKLVQLEMDLEEMTFPSVTICNINPYKLSAIKLNTQLEALLTVYDKVVNGYDVNKQAKKIHINHPI